jgi:hypothetical protein
VYAALEQVNWGKWFMILMTLIGIILGGFALK